jgi:hypothetical protein
LAASFVAQGWRLDTSATGSEDLSAFEPSRSSSLGSETNKRRLPLLASTRACGERRMKKIVCWNAITLEPRVFSVFASILFPVMADDALVRADFPRLPRFSRTCICGYTRATWKSSDSLHGPSPLSADSVIACCHTVRWSSGSRSASRLTLAFGYRFGNRGSQSAGYNPRQVLRPPAAHLPTFPAVLLKRRVRRGTAASLPTPGSASWRLTVR